MALFQKNPYDTNERKVLFTLGNQKSIVIVGLGNIGAKYHNTRHNIGFLCVDSFAQAHEFPGWTEKKDFNCYITTANLGESRVILCKPTTFMNKSGEAVKKLLHFYKLSVDDLTVVHDELDIPFGQIRTRRGGSAAGHNGIKSLIDHIGPDFQRIRIGIEGGKPDKMDASDFVLANFTETESSQLHNLTREITSVLTEMVYQGELTPDTRNFLV